MFINTGGLPEQHKPHNVEELHLQHHHHGYKHPQQFGKHYPPCRSRRLTARRHSLLPNPRCHGSLSPAAPLLKPWTPQPPLLCLNTPPHPSSSHPVQPYSSALHHTA
ncbi:transcription factor MYB120-like [Etheostoma cragini]|uniref:transcription factor MYB120-like n=1 Tax=Etheostoma cragini TaxID=417921 RepID=UPI00155F0FA4|nr:transcription factor MYB120-like [Etheostoma cragini]